MRSLIPWRKRRSNIQVRREEPYSLERSLIRLREELDSLMDRYFGDRFWSDWPAPSLLGGPERWSWDLGLEDRENEYVFRAELPGFEPDDFEIKVSGNVLTVRAEHQEEKKERGNGSSYRYGSLVRTFTLPQGVDTEHIDARYHSGVLEVRLPKTEQGRGKRIEVKTG